MKKIFLELFEQLRGVSALKFIDLDKGQIDYYDQRPRAAFPCAIFDFDTDAQTITENIQRVTGRLTIRVAFDYSGETAANTDNAVLQESLSYFDIIDAVKKSLHDYSSDQIDSIDHLGTQKESRDDGLTVRRLNFEIIYNEVI